MATEVKQTDPRYGTYGRSAIRVAVWLLLLALLALGMTCHTVGTHAETVRHASPQSVPVRSVVNPQTSPTHVSVGAALFRSEHSYPYVLPYRPVDIMSDFWACRGRRRRHEGIDFHGVGPDSGLGTPIYAIGRSEVLVVGRNLENPGAFGRPERRRSSVVRGGRRLPARAEIEGYGMVYFFTRSYGRWRTGNIVSTLLLDGPLEGYLVRYMHLGGIRPDLAAGAILEAGEELGLMGGSAVQDSSPHLHLDIEDPLGERVDPAPYLGLDTRPDGIPDC